METNSRIHNIPETQKKRIIIIGGGFAGPEHYGQSCTLNN